jgi:DNA repair protein RecO
MPVSVSSKVCGLQTLTLYDSPRHSFSVARVRASTPITSRLFHVMIQSMKELLTKAWVLDRIPAGEADELVTLYTEVFGKVRARAKSIRKITSKVSAHLQPLALTQVRLIHRKGPQDGFAVLDALAENSEVELRKKLIPIARLLRDMTDEWEQDPHLWEFIKKLHTHAMPEADANRHILSLLGFDAEHAACAFCNGAPVAGFIPRRHEFVCEKCASRIHEKEVLYSVK